MAAAKAAQDAITAAGARERPLCLRIQLRSGSSAPDPDAAIFAETVALAADNGTAGPHSSNKKRHRGQRRSASIGSLGNAGSSVSTGSRAAASAAVMRPASPATHMRNLSAIVNVKHEAVPNQEYHRDFWLPPDPSTKREPTHEAVKQETGRFATKQNIWGHRPTDYRVNGWYVENHWTQEAMHRSGLAPAASQLRSFPTDGPTVNQPWTKSTGVTSCMVGGNGGGANNRNVGSYEDSWRFHKDQYRPPTHGLSQSPITQFGGEMVMQKEMLRK